MDDYISNKSTNSWWEKFLASYENIFPLLLGIGILFLGFKDTRTKFLASVGFLGISGRNILSSLINNFIIRETVGVSLILLSLRHLFETSDRILTLLGAFLGWRLTYGFLVNPIVSAMAEISACLLFITSFRQYVPIEKEEWKMFIPFSLINAIFIFSYTTARQVKDTLLIGMGDQTLAVTAKLVTAAATFAYFAYYYSRASKENSYESLSGKAILPFIFFYIFHAIIYILFSNKVTFSPETVTYMLSKISKWHWVFLPNLWSTLLRLVERWPQTLYYIVSELMSSILITTLFYQVANYYFRRDQVKRIYPSFLVIAQFATLLSASIIKPLCDLAISPDKKIVTEEAAKYLVGGSAISIVIFLTSAYGLYKHLFRNVIEDKQVVVKDKKTSSSLEFLDTWKKFKETKPVFIFATLTVVFYGVMVGLIDFFFKGEIRSRFAGTDYTIENASILTLQSRMSIYVSLLGAGALAKYLNWMVGADFTPLLGILSTMFVFGASEFGSNPVFLEKAYQNLMKPFVASFRLSKYVLWDYYKEAYNVAQEPEDRMDIKNAEGSLSKMGKTLSSLLVFALLVPLKVSREAMRKPLWIIAIILGIMWSLSVYLMYKDLKKIESAPVIATTNVPSIN